MEKKKRVDKDQYFTNLAAEVAERSTCLLWHVGAVLVNPAGQIVSSGYNGAPSGEVDCLEREECVRDHVEGCRIAVHAEINACLNAGQKAKGCTMYLSVVNAETGEPAYFAPCLTCAALLLNAHVARVVMYHPENDAHASFTPKEIYDIRMGEIPTVVSEIRITTFNT